MSVLVGRRAPDFSTSAVTADGQIVPKFNFGAAIQGKYALVFFYPLDFTFVCPSELIALDHRMDAFKERDVEVVAVSVDSHFAHHAWRKTPISEGGIGPVRFTMAADISHRVCQSYGVEHPEAGVAFRGAFLIDPKGIVRAQIVNDLPLGRNIDDILRMFDALQFVENHGEVCPAGWKKGEKGMKATSDGVAQYLRDHGEDL